MKFFTEKKGSELIFDELDKIELLKMKDGVVEIAIKQDRNLKLLKKYWKLMASLAFHFENTKEMWHIHYKAKFLPLEEFRLPSGEKILYPSSIAFDKLDEESFRSYFNDIENYLIEKGYSVDDLINNC